MSACDADEILMRRSLLPASGLVDCVRRRDAAGVERLLVCRRRTEREWSALAIALADMVAAAEAGGSKPCTKCGEPKLFGEFYPHPHLPHGLQDWCRDCHNASKRKPLFEIPVDYEQREAS
jgi:hypothetical protein